jgi:hypothetical protein
VYAWCENGVDLGASFIVLLSLTAVAQILTALVPDTMGWRHHVHQKVALTMAIFYLPLTYMIVTSSKASTPARIIAYTCIAYMAVAASIFCFTKKVRNYYLVFQSLYIVAFQIIILSAAYV